MNTDRIFPVDKEHLLLMQVFLFRGPFVICKFLSRFARTIIFGKRKSCKLLIVN